MPLTDIPFDELRAYRPTVREPADFDTFWQDTVRQAREAASGSSAPVRTPASTPITELIVEDLTFPGFAGEPIRGWVIRPRREAGVRLPAVVEYLGYGGGRGLPGERVGWALAGFVHVVMDTRGQGSAWGTGGDTPDPHGSTPQFPGFMTKGILDPHEHYYRRVYTDALRLLDAVAAFDFVDAERIVTTGGSQGGGIAIAATALAQANGTAVRATLPDVAFLADWEHGADVAISDPYQELVRYLAVHRDHAEQVWTTASYLDAVNFAKRITVPALFSVSLMDEVVPPRTTFAAFNALGSSDTAIEVYRYNGHEGGQAQHWERQIAFVRARLG